MFKGSIVALVTPFKNGRVDEEEIKKLVEFHIQSGTNGILPCGTTGESPTLSHEEHKKVIEICIKAVAGRVPVLAGTGSNATDEAVTLTKHAAKAGAQGALIVSPYYNKPTQKGLYLHFKEIADNVDIPIILYNIAGRTAVNIEPSTMAKLANDCKNIIGVKEASGSLDQMQLVKSLCPKNFLLFSGDDALTLPVLSIGGVGIISVVANIIPADVVKLIELFNSGRLSEAQKLHYKMLPLIRSMFIETNPIPIKKAMELLSLCRGELRLPLCEISEENAVNIKAALKEYGLLDNKNGIRNKLSE
ncbi:MAG TPA: 4-hydroxy-tetrahydrodipicolinate synthase [Candidatus Omnitrophica bacterium]|nr:MAG: 4-hydroxy-tetrahydrodipicolinate synthase [Omnitrophica WOR_2 bacterium GWA2_45_18]OGX20648.1 MAG: 4-hydroxy-tetrahydrodipicolinate synthase [Omnitrophica WOR_2 bacterium GWC2_45_7]HBR15452.1 4-hydroxy-tetrahydrodipicolinate synthase [Candidatus Omnitrophota bacterium]